MSYDDFRADVTPGGLYNIDDVKILICYILENVNTPLTGKSICNIIREDSLANYFTIVQAISELTASENIIKDEDKGLIITEKGRTIAKELVTNIPFTVRERAIKAASKEILMEKRLKENNVSVEPDNNGYKLSLTMMDGENEFLSFSLHLGNLEQANKAKESFLNDPTAFYLSNIKVLLGYEQNKEVL